MCMPNVTDTPFSYHMDHIVDTIEQREKYSIKFSVLCEQMG